MGWVEHCSGFWRLRYYWWILSLKSHVTVEDRIRQFRQFFSEKTDISSITNCQIKNVEQLLNGRPVRKFNYKTPNQVLLEKIALTTWT